jgi:hypothetical protein
MTCDGTPLETKACAPALDFVPRVAAGHHHDGRLRELAPDRRHRLGAIGARQVEIDDDQHDATVLLRHPQRRFGAVGMRNLQRHVGPALEKPGQRLPEQGVIVDQQHAGPGDRVRWGRGSREVACACHR